MAADYSRGEQYSPAMPEEQLRRCLQHWYRQAPTPPVAGMTPAVARGGWIPLFSSPLTPCELYGDITPGATDVLAWPLNPDYSRNSTPDPPMLHVSDEVLGDVRAYGSNHSGFTTGAKGFYIAGTDGKNQIVAIQRLSKLCSALTTGNIYTTDSTFTVNTVVPLDDEQSPVSSSSDTLAVNNWCSWQANSSGLPLLICPDGAGNWNFLQGGCWPAPGGG